jgi:hypothetical protein
MSKIYREALESILESNSLYIAKEIAAEALEVDVQEYFDIPDDAFGFYEQEEEEIDIGTDSNIEDILREFQ